MRIYIELVADILISSCSAGEVLACGRQGIHHTVLDPRWADRCGEQLCAQQRGLHRAGAHRCPPVGRIQRCGTNPFIEREGRCRGAGSPGRRRPEMSRRQASPAWRKGFPTRNASP